MKKLLFVTSSYPFGEREASFIRPEIAKLSEKFDITLVSRNSVDEQTSQTPENVKVLRYNNQKSYNVVKYLLKTLFSPYIYGEMIKLIKKKKLSLAKIKKAIKFCMRSFHFADYLKDIRDEMGEKVVLYTYWNDYSVMSLSLVKRSKDKLVSRTHRIELYEREENNYYLPLKEISNRKTDVIAFISEEGKEYFSENFKTEARKEVHRLGVKKQEKTELNVKENTLSIYSFSYVVPVKRLDRIINVLENIPESTKIDWVHIGDGDLMDAIKAQAKQKLDCKSNITYKFLGGMENSKALEYIGKNDFDLLINLSDSEGLPVTMMEAMSFGIPVLALDVGGVHEIVKDRVNGYLLLPDSDNKKIADVLVSHSRLTENEMIEMRNNAYRMWEQEFYDEKNYTHFVKKLENL